MIYGNSADLARQWAKNNVDLLKAGDIETLIETFKPFSSTHSQVATTIGYFDRNRERMRYREFRNQQLCVSSSVVEAGC